MTIDTLTNLVDQYDIDPRNGIPEEVEAQSIDEGFVASLEALMIADEDPSHTEAYYFNALDSYLDRQGLKTVYDIFHNPCSPVFNSILCRQSQAEPIQPEAEPLIDTKYIDRVLRAIDNIAKVDPPLARSLVQLLNDRKIVFIDEEAPKPAFVDPRSGTIVIYRSLFSEDRAFSQPRARSPFGRTIIDWDSGMSPRTIQEYRPPWYRRLFSNSVPSDAESRLRREALYSGKGYTLHVEEVLSHEAYHLYQFGKLISNDSSDDKNAQDEINGAGLSYATLAYEDLFSRTLDQFGYDQGSLDVFTTLSDDERTEAEDEGIPPLVDDSYSFTEEGAKIFAGEIVTKLSLQQQSALPDQSPVPGVF